MPSRHRTIPIASSAVPLVQIGGRFRTVDPADAADAADAGNAVAAGASTGATLKGRGTAWAIAHRFQSDVREAVDDGWGVLDQEANLAHLAPQTTVIEEHAKRILSANDSPDIHFDLSINPYRGCEHVMRHQKLLRELTTPL